MSQLLFFNFQDYFKTSHIVDDRTKIYRCLGEDYEYEDYSIDEKFKEYLIKFCEENKDYKIFCIADDYSSFSLNAKEKFLKNNFPEMEIQVFQVAHLSKKSYLVLYLSEFYNGPVTKHNKSNIHIIESNPQVLADYKFFGLDTISMFDIYNS